MMSSEGERRPKRCRDCCFLEAEGFRGHIIYNCTHGCWRKWYAFSTVCRNRPPVRHIGATCKYYLAREFPAMPSPEDQRRLYNRKPM